MSRDSTGEGGESDCGRVNRVKPASSDEDSESDGEDSSGRSATLNRRRFMEATGLGVAGLAGLYGGARLRAQESTIHLEARQVAESAAAYAGDDGYVTEEEEGVEAAAEDWEDEWIDTNTMTDVVDAWTAGEQVAGDAGPYRWRGVSPADVDGEVNPTLDLVEGETYTVEITDETADPHEFVIVDDAGRNLLDGTASVDQRGDTASVTFTATESMSEYYCAHHPSEMRGEVSVGERMRPDLASDRLEVLYLGGVEDGATHYSEELLKEVGPFLLEAGIEVHYTERQADLNPETLSHYDAVMLYGNRLDPTPEQIDALVEFVESGGGFVPVHSASASFQSSPAYVELVGGSFDWHGDGVMSTNRTAHPVFEGVDEITSWEETYRHTNLNDDIQVLATGEGADFAGGEPFTWVREQGDGRVFYTAWGHSDVWETTGFKQLLRNALRWAAGEAPLPDAAETGPSKGFTHVSEYGHSEIPKYGGPAPDEVSTNDDGVWDLVQDPFSVADSMAHAATPGAFDLEYFVSETLLPDRVEGQILDMAFDARGRCWLSVTQDYPNDGGAGNDSIVICEDANGDRIADEFTVFAEGLSIPHSIVPHEDGVIVAEVGSPPEGRVVYLGDEDGDDVADVEDVLFTGYGTFDTHAGLNQLYRGIDNWIYGCVGYAGLTPSIDPGLELSQDVFRFRPDGSEIEFVGSGASNMAGVKTNEEGLVFCSSATAGDNVTTHVAIPAPYYDHVEGFEGTTTVDVRSPTTLSRTDDPNRFLELNDRVRQFDWHSGFTAATDQEIYTAREFPRKYWNGATFVSDGTGNLTATFYLERDGPTYEASYHDNLFASNDEWTSPTYVNTGPDGMVWLIDYYNFVFQHNPTPEGYETGSGNSYVTNVRDQEHGRLYRVTTGEDVDLHPRDLDDATPSELIDALSDDTMFWRKTAQRRLIERGETGVVDDLVDLAVSEDVDAVGIDGGSIHALWTLAGLDAVEANESALHAAFDHSSAAVRLNAVRALPDTAATRDAVLEHDLLNDPDARVRMWVMLELAKTPPSTDAGISLYQAVSQGATAGDSLLTDAATVGGATHHEGFIAAYEAAGGSGGSVNLLANPGFEDAAGGDPATPAGWEATEWQGTAELVRDTAVSRSGGASVRVSSSADADASWSQTYDVEPNTTYRFSAYVRTGEDFQPTDGYGATVNVHEIGESSVGDVVDAPGQDWTLVTTTVDSGANETLTFNCLFGGYGHAVGTVWFDDASLEPVGSSGGAADVVYDRLVTHRDLLGEDSDDPDVEVIEPGQTIQLDGAVSGWLGTGPAAVEGETNPTLTLYDGETYTVEWTNADGVSHDFQLLDGSNPFTSSVLDSTARTSQEGETLALTFTADPSIGGYRCEPHAGEMSGEVNVL